MADVVAALERIVEAACAAETNIFGYGIWSHHITQVVQNVAWLAPHFGTELEIVTVAALLHDYAAICDAALYAEHHLHGAREAKRLLTALEYSRAKIPAVMACITTHRARVPALRDTPEAACLANADAVAHIQQVPSLLYLAYMQYRMGIDDGADWVRQKVQRSWTKLSPEVQPLIAPQYAAALTLLAPPEQRARASCGASEAGELAVLALVERGSLPHAHGASTAGIIESPELVHRSVPVG